MSHNRFSFAVFIYIFNNDFSKILLVKRNEEKRKKWGFDWGTIGGEIEPGEMSYEAAIREAQEEIGIEIEDNKLKFLYFEERPSKIHAPAVHFFYAVSIDENSDIKLNDEADGFEWFELKSLPEKAINSSEQIIKIRDIIKST